MDLYDAIFKLKSNRSYEMSALPPAVFIDLEAAIAGFVRLYADVPLDYRFTDQTKGMFSVKAPHYLIIGGSGMDGELEAAGFLFEQANLWLSASGYGTIWLAGARDAHVDKPGDFVTIAFGTAASSPYRSLAEFKRKAIGEITNAPDDICIQAARLAPSGMNGQPWYFLVEGLETYVYAKKARGSMPMAYKLTDLDVGIALAHYAIAAAKEDRPFAFARSTDLPALDGFVPFGVIS